MVPDLPDMTSYAAAREGFTLHTPDDFHFAWDVVGARAAGEGKNRDAFAFVPNEGEPSTVTFAALDEASSRVAAGLRQLGLQPGDRALLMIPRVPAFYEVLLGCMKAGVVAAPGTNLLTAKDIRYRADRSGAKAAIVMDVHEDKVDAVFEDCATLAHRVTIGGARPGWTSYAELASAPPLTRDAAPSTRATDPMLLYFTSGTTAYPKMVVRDFAYGLAHAITGRYWMDLREGDRHWTLTDTGWAKAAWGLVFPPWLYGATTILFEGAAKFDVDRHLRLVEALGVTTFCAPPTIYRLFAQHDLSAYDLSSIRRSLSAGEPLNPEVIRVWEGATGTEPADGYGQTETVNLVGNFPGVAVRPGSMGKPVPGLDVRVVDDAGQDAGDGEIGHIAVKIPDGADPRAADANAWPPGLFRGYEGEQGQDCFRNGFYYTGDTARRDADGYIWFVGRSDDVISSAAYRISPFEVESALQEHPAVAESAVVAEPDELRGHIVVAFVVPAAGHAPGDALAEQLQAHVRETTAPYKYPRKIYFRSSLPKTISGKIRRVELRDEVEADPAPPEDSESH